MSMGLQSLLAEIRKGKGPSCLVLHGDDFQVHEAIQAILDLVAPGRSFNLERFDGRTTPWDQIEASLMTPPLFAPRKAVFIEEVPYFLSREHTEDLRERVLRLWREGKEEEGARHFLELLLATGWTQERWEQAGPPLSRAELGELFGEDADDVGDEAEALLALCRGKGWALKQRGVEAERLIEFLEQGLPPWDFLLMTAAHVDRRNRLYKKFAEKGAALDLAVARERSGRISREVLRDFLRQRLVEAGKRIEAPAEEMIVARAGEQLWAVHQELEKLLLYVGEEPWIRAKDVAEICLDLDEGWIFDLTNAIAERDASTALGHLERLLSQGNHPLRLLGVVASEVRRFLAARQLIGGKLRESWRPEMSYEQFQRSVLKHGPPMLGRNPYRDYVTFKSAAKFTTAELVRALERIYQADTRLKSTSHPPRLVLERLVLDMCQPLRVMQNEN